MNAAAARLAPSRIIGVATLIICILTYLRTLAPGVTWANDGYDSGDLITAAVTGGVAHPTGYPTYLLLARLFQLLPIDDPALKVTLLSATAAALAVFVLYDLALAWLGSAGWRASAASGIAALSLGLSPLFWSQAVVAEVYSLNALFVALLLRFSLTTIRTPTAELSWAERLRAIICGLALGNHLTILPLIVLWLGWSSRATGQQRWPTRLAGRLAWVAVGLLVYMYLPLCAIGEPPIFWGRPSDWSGFWWLVSGQLYAGLAFGLSGEFLGQRVAAWAQLLAQQFNWVGIGLGCFGLLYGSERDRALLWSTCGLAAIYTAFAIGYNTAGSLAYLIPVYQIFALWVGLGVYLIIEAAAARRIALALPTALALLALLFWPVLQTARRVDASQDRRAISYAVALLNEVPTSALLLTVNDQDTFPIWYYHFALGQRPDLAVIAEPLLDFAWYRANLRVTYPYLKVPDAAPAGWSVALAKSNRERGPLCRTDGSGTTALNCR